MICPSCQSPRSVKNGLMRGLQRYKCKDCGCNYTRSYAHYRDKETKRHFALSLYMSGLGFHSISRLLGVSHVSVINWVKRYGGDQLEYLRNSRPMAEKSDGSFMLLLDADIQKRIKDASKKSKDRQPE